MFAGHPAKSLGLPSDHLWTQIMSSALAVSLGSPGSSSLKATREKLASITHSKPLCTGLLLRPVNAKQELSKGKKLAGLQVSKSTGHTSPKHSDDDYSISYLHQVLTCPSFSLSVNSHGRRLQTSRPLGQVEFMLHTARAPPPW